MAQTYDPYGTVYASAGSGASSAGFTGEFTDANGLVYLRARYYQPSMGRFFQMDPSRQEVNPYWYSSGNPVNWTDLSGLCTDRSALNYDGKIWPFGEGCKYDTTLGLRDRNQQNTRRYINDDGSVDWQRFLDDCGLDKLYNTESQLLDATDLGIELCLVSGICIEPDTSRGDKVCENNPVLCSRAGREAAEEIADEAAEYIGRYSNEASSEFFYRAMSDTEYARVIDANGLVTRDAGSNYLGVVLDRDYAESLVQRRAGLRKYPVVVEFEVEGGTVQNLIDLGATHNSAALWFPDHPPFVSGMDAVQLKLESQRVLSFGLGSSPQGLQEFNQAIRAIRRLS